MDQEDIFALISFTIPTIITGVIAYYFFSSHIKNEEGRRRFLLHKENQKAALPLRLQAYERMVLFLERINPSKLLIRITPITSDKNDYENLVIHQIEQEFEHNLTQQIYMSEGTWNVIVTTKNTIIQTIRKTGMSDKIDSANRLREVILSDLLDKQSPTTLAIEVIKKEISEIW